MAHFEEKRRVNVIEAELGYVIREAWYERLLLLLVVVVKLLAFGGGGGGVVIAGWKSSGCVVSHESEFGVWVFL